ncbi:hypothetical protein GO986_16795 [Deinococcus sp. HMF7620]|uniref:Uncharacterized protein n=1 Tax=Deinococcus arboris TaxID=2682977 RepID=A0A7C9MSV5_9DEIO|nr:hypothetical protein [Deinococcus arboris]
MTFPDEIQAALLAEGDTLARHLTQTLHVTVDDPARLTLLGRSLATNLVGALLPTAEHVSRRAGLPVLTSLTLDPWGRLQVQTCTPDGELRARLGVDDLLLNLLFTRTHRLHPQVQEALQGALGGSEHQATRALVACLRSPPVLRGMETCVRLLMTAENAV